MKPIKTEALHLNTFGQSNYRKEKCEVLSLRLKKRDREVDIIVLDYPVICSPLPSKIRIDQPHLEGLDFADDFDDNSGNIDILVGSYYY